MTTVIPDVVNGEGTNIATMMFTVMMSHCISFIGDDNDWKEIL
jgi:hypothetical protein